MVDFHWIAFDPWTIVSVFDDGENSGGGGGTPHVIRISQFYFENSIFLNL